MNKEIISFVKNDIKEIVNEHGGIKLTDLILKIDISLSKILTAINLFEIVDGMVEDGELIAIEYTLPNMDYRLKTFLLPGGSEVTVKRTCCDECC